MNPTYSLENGVAWVQLDDGKANAMRTEGLRTLSACLDGAAQDGAGAIVIRGRDGMFSAGLDLKWLPTLDADGVAELNATFSSTMLRVLESPIPTVGLVSGHAVAGGCMLACACDRRIGVAGDWRLQLNEVAIGIPMPSWAALIAARAIPAPRLYDLLQLAEPISFAEARAIGALHAIADDPSALDAAGAEAAAQLALLNAPAFARSKHRLWAERTADARARLATE